MMRDAAMLAYASIFHREIGFFLPSDLCWFQLVSGPFGRMHLRLLSYGKMRRKGHFTRNAGYGHFASTKGEQLAQQRKLSNVTRKNIAYFWCRVHPRSWRILRIRIRDEIKCVWISLSFRNRKGEMKYVYYRVPKEMGIGNSKTKHFWPLVSKAKMLLKTL